MADRTLPLVAAHLHIVLHLKRLLCHTVLLKDANYYSFHTLSSRVLFKLANIKLHITTILPVVLYACETWLLTPQNIY